MKINYIVPVNNEVIFNENIGRSKLYLDHPELFILQKGYDNIPRAYNDALKKTNAEYLCFLHQDIFLPDDWNIEIHIKSLLDFGVIGVAGKKGNKYIGYILDRGKPWGSPEGLPAEVETLDEQLFVVKNSNSLKFDENVGNHLYCVDLCLQAKLKGLKNYAINAYCEHNSKRKGGLLSEFWDSHKYLQKKYKIRINTAAT